MRVPPTALKIWKRAEKARRCRARLTIVLAVRIVSHKSKLPVEKFLAGRLGTIPDTEESLRQGRTALARTVQDPLPEPLNGFFNRLEGLVSHTTAVQQAGV
jgi:hypothetical protein